MRQTNNLFRKSILLTAICMFMSGCFKEDHYENTPQGNFEALWKIIDEDYCFFAYKAVNWNDIRKKYSAYITDNLNDYQLFDILSRMLAELKDGHVNLFATHDIGRYWQWKENHPENFDEIIQKHYLKQDYRISGGLKYQILEDNIGYIYYESFSSGIGDGNLNEAIAYLSICKGIILDIRNNAGGQLTNSTKLASRFIEKKTLVGYIRHKTGKGHYDFSDPYPIYVEPSKHINFLTKPLALLTNRSCYSAANDFVNIMQHSKNTFTVGDQTGGGSGLPFSAELPNGWSVRFSTSPITNSNDQHLEYGITPDYPVEMTQSDKEQNKDTIIETARKLIHEKYSG